MKYNKAQTRVIGGYTPETARQIAATVQALTAPDLPPAKRQELEANGIDFGGLAEAINEAATRQPSPAGQDRFRAAALNVAVQLEALPSEIKGGNLAALLLASGPGVSPSSTEAGSPEQQLGKETATVLTPAQRTGEALPSVAVSGTYAPNPTAIISAVVTPETIA